MLLCFVAYRSLFLSICRPCHQDVRFELYASKIQQLPTPTIVLLISCNPIFQLRRNHSGRSTWFSTRIVCLSNYLVQTGALCSPFGIFSLAIPITAGWPSTSDGTNRQHQELKHREEKAKKLGTASTGNREMGWAQQRNRGTMEKIGDASQREKGAFFFSKNRRSAIIL